MAYAASQRITISAVPVVDIGPLVNAAETGDATSAPLRSAAEIVGREMRRAAEEVGFFYVSGHGVPEAVFRNAGSRALEFFRQSEATKQTVAINESHHGYLQVGEARMEDATHIDLKESFVWGLEGSPSPSNPFIGNNRWPADAAFREALGHFFDSTSRCAVALMQSFAAAMNLPPDAFIGKASQPISRGTCIYYPPQPSSMGNEQFGVAPHTDYGCLTLLWQEEAGLEVRHREGHWVAVPPIEGTLVVNVGDLLARWTNDSFRSTEHRVINRTGRERLSLALFWDPDYDTVVDAGAASASPKYAPVSCGDYVRGRYDGSFSYRQSAIPPSGTP